MHHSGSISLSLVSRPSLPPAPPHEPPSRSANPIPPVLHSSYSCLFMFYKYYIAHIIMHAYALLLQQPVCRCQLNEWDIRVVPVHGKPVWYLWKFDAFAPSSSPSRHIISNPRATRKAVFYLNAIPTYINLFIRITLMNVGIHLIACDDNTMSFMEIIIKNKHVLRLHYCEFLHDRFFFFFFHWTVFETNSCFLYTLCITIIVELYNNYVVWRCLVLQQIYTCTLLQYYTIESKTIIISCLNIYSEYFINQTDV